ncbi:MAG: PEGA domain-containing protein [Acidobacteriota bacterium]
MSSALKWIVLAATVVAIAGVGYLVYSVMNPPKPPAEATVVAPAPAPPPQRRVEPAPEPARPAARPRPKREQPAAPMPAPPPEPAGPVLIVESDVPGASVFVDRVYLGTTPVRTTDVKPGQHQLNASAENQDGIARAISVAETGETTIALRFLEVTLDASIDVVHKHGIGSCQGTLRATTAGLRYETTNEGDAFALSFGEIEVFDVDYLKKNLRVKKAGGKTWNFTDRNDNADRLFIFHRDVTKAREKLALPPSRSAVLPRP